ncbi:HD domain-containing protein [Neobacillus sp. D3-1R]|uniref:HD domain-containing protein n=1 Tax=Neobacillus sp. D3-1R TaxID=3445778 RepID=UPI003F9EE6DF
MNNQRLLDQIQFIVEIDKLKSIFRQSFIMDKSRNENDAEHTWHLSVMAIILLEHANDAHLDILKVLKMILIHDLVEIDAGDTFLYDEQGYMDKEERELKAAKRLFGLLPADQQEEYFSLWREFETKETPEARFAGALDRLHPLLHNYYTEGHTWKKHGLTSDRVLDKNKQIEWGSKELWKFAEDLIHDAVRKGYLEK